MVNVIIPIFHSRKTLPKTLDSLVAQTKPHFMVTLVQDGDGEDYSDIIEEYKKRGLKLFLIELKENSGPGVARQAGIDASEMCDYVMFLDSDDMLFPQAIDTLYGNAKAHNLDILSSSFIRERTHNSNMLVAAKDSITWSLGKIYRTAFFKEIGLRFLDDLRFNEDAYFNFCAINCAEHYSIIEEITGLWRDNPESLTRSVQGDELFGRSGPTYIYSQIKGLQKVLDYKPDLTFQTICLTLINIYKYMMEQEFRGNDNYFYMDQLLELKKNPIIHNLFQKVEAWQYIAQNLPGAILKTDCLIFPATTFSEWVKKYVYDENLEIPKN